MERRLLLPRPPSARSLARALGRGLEVDPPRALAATHLDTFDWRLAEVGASLTREVSRGADTLRWQAGAERAPYLLPIDRELRFACDLPEGFLRSELEPIVDGRALLAMACCRIERRPARLTDGHGNTLVRLLLEHTTPLDAAGHTAGAAWSSLLVQRLPGQDEPFQEVLDRLRAAGASELDWPAELERAAAARGRRPGDYSSKLRLRLEPSQRADHALRTILADLLATLRANVEGVVEDVDTEFLHDLRVASRRARSALAQVKEVLPQPVVDRLAEELRWLGTVTNPCRDLDVWLAEMAAYRARLGDVACDLAPLERLLERSRRQALRRVRAGLRSARFSRLLESWQAVVAAPPAAEPEPANAAVPIASLAGVRILKAYRRMVRRASELGNDPPRAALHRLRIDGKKLRYLLEFFSSLYAAETVGPLVGELKQLQDILGGLNDLAVQQARLVELARDLMAGDDARAETLLAMGRVAAAMADRQREHRRALAGALAAFSSKGSRAQYESLFGGS